MNINRPLMSEKLQISVIIPVYNAGPYVRKAVESALEQPETAEVILIEDGSPDNSLEVCRELEKEYEKVRLFTHPNNENLGAGPTRNVGIENAKFDYIAFLDADDFFLPDRFRAERRIFKEHPDADGVYGAAGFHSYSDADRDFYFRGRNYEMITFSKRIPPKQLFDAIIGVSRAYGGLSIMTLTVKRDVFNIIEPFPAFRLCQDLDLIYRAAYKCNLYAGDIENPICMVGVHDRNRMVRVPKESTDKSDMLRHLKEWALTEQLPHQYVSFFENRARVEELKRMSRAKALFRFILAVLSRDTLLKHKFLISASLNHIFGAKFMIALKRPFNSLLKDV